MRKIKPIIAKAAACFGIAAATSLVIAPHSSQNDVQTVLESEAINYTPIIENPVKSKKSRCYVCVLEMPQTKAVPEDETLDVRYLISDEERDAIERIVASEGGYCEYEFQALVAELILNGCEANGIRPLELFDCGVFWITNNVEPTEVTKQAVSDVFDKGIMPTDERIQYYYNPSYCQSAVHEEMRYVFTHTGCRFFTDW